MSDYDFETIERRWQEHWERRGTFEVKQDAARQKFYCLEMLPYPSGDIHVGHVRNYCITDVVARYKRMRGFNVMHPIGWDALGLPAENAAIQRKTHPEKWTRSNIAGMKRQLQRMGFSYPWSREIATCDPEYYRWNQWFFLRMLDKGIAYRAKAAVNWCPSCQTVLANEQAEGGECWRCRSSVEERELDQWFLRITAYQDQLLDDMRELSEWPERVLVQQRNWFGRSEGAEIDFPVEGGESLRVFTTRIDTIYGATFMVLAPEHPMVDVVLRGTQGEAEARQGVARLHAQDKRDRQAGQVDKEGVFTGRYALNPFSGERIPIWVGNFVLMGYGTGAIMAVPAHDQRDFEFARKYEIPVRVVIQPEGGELDGDSLSQAYSGEGRLVASGAFDGLRCDDAIRRMTAHAEKKGFGRAAITWRLKDWLISRQRYWGTPIPIVHCDKHGPVGVPDEELPVVLPSDAPFTGEGGNPLTKVSAFVKAKCPRCGAPARRETDTMDTFVDSSWYFYRYLSPRETSAPIDREAVRYWFPIDLYVGGIEHAILHLVYARFWTKVMRDLGLVELNEPVTRLFPQGMVHVDGEVMSKSKGNTVAPDEVITDVGADTLRLYMLFESAPDKPVDWNQERISGAHRFLQKLFRLVERRTGDIGAAGPAVDGNARVRALRRKTHQTIQKLTDDLERLHLNTGVSALMELLNEVLACEEALSLSSEGRAAIKEAVKSMLVLLAPFAPHICEELWQRLGHESELVDHPWPEAEPEVARADEVELAVQINGRVRARITVPADAARSAIEARALAEPRIQEQLSGRTPKKVVVVPGRLVSLVVP